MSIKQQVIELVKEYLHKGEPSGLIEKIQAIPDEVTLREVKECCKKKKLCKLKKGMFNCQITKDPCDWNIDAITKAIRGK